MAKRVAQPDKMPLMRKFEIWLDKVADDPVDPNDLLRIMMSCYTRLREQLTRQETLINLVQNTNDMETLLTEGHYVRHDPVTLEPQLYVLRERREDLGEVRFREFLGELKHAELPDFFNEEDWRDIDEDDSEGD